MTLSWTDGHGKQVSKPVNLSIPDVQAFRGLAGYPWLLIAANPHMSATELLMLLETEGIGRSHTWVKRRLWMLRRGDADATRPVAAEDVRAVELMRENETLSLRGLRGFLLDHGIKRSVDWVRRHRCD